MRRWQREGFIAKGGSFNWTWFGENKETLATINVRINHSAQLTLEYRLRRNGGEWQNVNQAIDIATTANNYGGSRVWFVCPCCRKRVAHVYLVLAPRCRTCLRLVYRSQSNDDIGRVWSKIYKIEAKLENKFYRPKGVHYSTYLKLRREYIKQDIRLENALMGAWGRLMAVEERIKSVVRIESATY